ncbi:MAG: hypothetical protein M1269_13895 [Chloroflexi bacterium]|nr:hypothetical protein [Chloroflexota bacterium]
MKILLDIFLWIVIVIAAIIWLPIIFNFLRQFFILFTRPIFASIASFKAFRKYLINGERITFGQKWVFLPFSIFGISLFLLAQGVLWAWIIIFTIYVMTSWDIIWGLGISILLPPLAIFAAPFIAWYKSGFTAFISVGTLLLMVIFWFFFSKLSFTSKIIGSGEIESEDYDKFSPEQILGYSPNLFILGALSLQVIASPIYYLAIYVFPYGSIYQTIAIWTGFILSNYGGFFYLLLAIITAFMWLSAKKKLSEDLKERLYKPSVWIYILGFFFTSILGGYFNTLEVHAAVINWLNGYFLVALIIRFIGFIYRKFKTHKEKGLEISLEKRSKS